jgi:hypothetical protein
VSPEPAHLQIGTNMVDSDGVCVIARFRLLATCFAVVLLLAGAMPIAAQTPHAHQPCDVTKPNGMVPPNQLPNPKWHGNDVLIVGWLEENGSLYGKPILDGQVSAKLVWYRFDRGAPLTITGHLADDPSMTLRAGIPEGYEETFIQASGVTFPTQGCWVITGSVPNGSLTFTTMVVPWIPTSTPVTSPDD